MTCYPPFINVMIMSSKWGDVYRKHVLGGNSTMNRGRHHQLQILHCACDHRRTGRGAWGGQHAPQIFGRAKIRAKYAPKFGQMTIEHFFIYGAFAMDLCCAFRRLPEWKLGNSEIHHFNSIACSTNNCYFSFKCQLAFSAMRARGRRPWFLFYQQT